MVPAFLRGSARDHFSLVRFATKFSVAWDQPRGLMWWTSGSQRGRAAGKGS